MNSTGSNSLQKSLPLKKKYSTKINLQQVLEEDCMIQIHPKWGI